MGLISRVSSRTYRPTTEMLKLTKTLPKKYVVDVSKGQKYSPGQQKYRPRFDNTQSYYQPEGAFNSIQDEPNMSGAIGALKANFAAGKRTYVSNTTLVVVAMIVLGLVNRGPEQERQAVRQELNRQGCEVLRDRNAVLLQKQEDRELKRRLREHENGGKKT